MSNVRPAIALNARSFGRGPTWLRDAPKVQAPISGDLKLFATTFLAGFVFVSMLLA
jgi:hypothetical protein